MQQQADLCVMLPPLLTVSKVKVSRIHVRYEDHVTNVGTKFSVGVTLDNLELKVLVWSVCGVIFVCGVV